VLKPLFLELDVVEIACRSNSFQSLLVRYFLANLLLAGVLRFSSERTAKYTRNVPLSIGCQTIFGSSFIVCKPYWL
jgi:hypothetical protein